jgi:hypothetical protein
MLLTITPRATTPYFQRQTAVLQHGILDIFVKQATASVV